MNTDDGPEEFQWLLYCYHCGRRLNDPDDVSTKEVAPQECARCKLEDAHREGYAAPYGAANPYSNDELLFAAWAEGRLEREKEQGS